MTDEQRKTLDRINEYANQVLADINPQKTQVSYQLEKLRPIMEEIAKEKGIPVEDVFIEYMDLASEAGIEEEQKFQSTFSDIANDL